VDRVVRRVRLAAAANIQHDRAELGGTARALLDVWVSAFGWRPIIDPLLKDVRLVPPFRGRAVGKAACYLVQATGDSGARLLRHEDKRAERMIPGQSARSQGQVR